MASSGTGGGNRSRADIRRSQRGNIAAFGKPTPAPF